VHVVPLIRIEPLPETPEAVQALRSLPEQDLLVLTSANAVRELAARAAALGVALDGLRARVIAVGPATAEAARAAGLAVDALPKRYDAEGLVEALGAGALRGCRVLLPRAERGRDLLPDALRAAGAHTQLVALYRTLPDPVAGARLRDLVARGELDALIFASPSAVRAFADGLDGPTRAAFQRVLVAALGPVTAQALREAGRTPDVVPARAELHALVEALAEAARNAAGRRPGAPGGTS